MEDPLGDTLKEGEFDSVTLRSLFIVALEGEGSIQVDWLSFVAAEDFQDSGETQFISR